MQCTLYKVKCERYGVQGTVKKEKNVYCMVYNIQGTGYITVYFTVQWLPNTCVRQSSSTWLMSTAPSRASTLEEEHHRIYITLLKTHIRSHSTQCHSFHDPGGVTPPHHISYFSKQISDITHHIAHSTKDHPVSGPWRSNTLTD